MSNKTNAVRAILMDASECDRPETDNPDTIEISAADLQLILERHITEPAQCLHQIAEPAAIHTDDAAVDALAEAMKAKLAKQRAKGYGGWDTDCTQERLSELLRQHVDKGDPVDVANFCAFLQARGEGIAAAPQAVQPAVPVGGQSRFKGEQDWVWCSIAHVSMVLATPLDWQNYEVRYVYAHPAEEVPEQAFKTKVYQALGIGSACNEDAVFVNIENARRRADCLSAIEREFFMVETPPDESEGDTEPGEECLLNWGHTPTQYVQQFAEAFAATQPAAQGLDAQILNFINDKRVALTPEYEGPWKAEVFADEAEPVITTEGNTVRDAVSAALAVQAKQGGA